MKENIKYVLFALLVMMSATLIFFAMIGMIMPIYYLLYWIVRFFVSDSMAKTIAMVVDATLFMVFFVGLIGDKRGD